MTTSVQGTTTSTTGRQYTWNSRNQLVGVDQRDTYPCNPTCPQRANLAQADTLTSGSVTSLTPLERYVYDADGQRAGRTANGQTTAYFHGYWEDTLGVNARKLYLFNGEVVAARDGSGTVTYLRGDHLGSVGWQFDTSGTQVGGEEYGPWGGIRAVSGTLTNEPLNYTGQRRDTTGLLFYHARYYDPTLGRFLSPDTIVPGADALSATPVGSSGGPNNPQNLNRYSYVNNNPIDHTDPTGHFETPVCLGCDPSPNTLHGRVLELHGQLHPVASKMRTTAIVRARTPDGETVDIVSSSEARLDRRQTLREGEIAAEGEAGVHAEVKGFDKARELGYTPEEYAASRDICPDCEARGVEEGTIPRSPLESSRSTEGSAVPRDAQGRFLPRSSPPPGSGASYEGGGVSGEGYGEGFGAGGDGHKRLLE